MGVSRTGFQAMANAIWSLVAVGSRTVTVTTNSDKTGYSLATSQFNVRRLFHQNITATSLGTSSSADTTLSETLTDWTKAVVIVTNPVSSARVYLTANGNVRITNVSGGSITVDLSIYVIEFMNVLS